MSTAPDLEAKKAAIRKRIRASLARLGPEQRRTAGELIRNWLVQQPAWKEAKTVLFFAPMAKEPDIWPLLTQAIQEGKTVALPAYSTTAEAYEVRQVRHAGREVVSGQFGIREPNSSCALVPLNGLDLALVPGIGFDLHGHRLGRGKGHYDRLLASVNGIKCGVAFDAQVVAEIPTGPHDIRVNCILTPTRWIET